MDDELNRRWKEMGWRELGHFRPRAGFPSPFERQQANPESAPASKSRVAKAGGSETIIFGFKSQPPLHMTLTSYFTSLCLS